jgi:hypothetical protein
VARTSPTALRSGLDAAVTALSSAIRKLCPDASLDIAFTRYEDEDAHIWITAPARLSPAQRERFANGVAQLSLDTLVQDGFLIVAGLEENGAEPAGRIAPVSNRRLRSIQSRVRGAGNRRDNTRRLRSRRRRRR